jgi:hypothetical protein
MTFSVPWGSSSPTEQGPGHNSRMHRIVCVHVVTIIGAHSRQRKQLLAPGSPDGARGWFASELC